MSVAGGSVHAAETLDTNTLWIIKDESQLSVHLPVDEREHFVSLTRYPARERATWVSDIVALRREPETDDAEGNAWPRAFDPALAHIVNSTAGKLQALARERGLKSVNERDHLQPCCAAAARDVGAAWRPRFAASTQVKVELDPWPRLGNIDVALTMPDNQPVFLELKCGHGSDALGQCVWDTAKLALTLQCGEGGSGFLLAGAPTADWQRPVRGAEFFEDGHHEASLLRVLYGDWWRHWEHHDDPQPSELPDSWWTEHVYTARLKVGETPWQLRLAQVLCTGRGRLQWPRLA